MLDVVLVRLFLPIDSLLEPLSHVLRVRDFHLDFPESFFIFKLVASTDWLAANGTFEASRILLPQSIIIANITDHASTFNLTESLFVFSIVKEFNLLKHLLQGV